MKYNTTQLDIERAFERGIYHRDYFAHFLRWTHILKISKIGMNVLDVACGTGALGGVLYRNMHKCTNYIGVDVNKNSLAKATDKLKNVDWIKFYHCDFVTGDGVQSVIIDNDIQYDIITCFEAVEHIGKQNIDAFLNNIKRFASEKTIIALSTPCHDAKVGAAKNHIINGINGEFEFEELRSILLKHFDVIKIYGTFASIKDYKELLEDWQLKTFNALAEYYDTHTLSVIMAPMVEPSAARNCLWILKLRENN